ncbi:MAG: exodeoxyribonuclease VII small subunit [Saprospiraceae bacterium]|jgi:exodeoxyribonuclease VII small subunit|nr:exodeoxyribonuclease VII small subunit [Saprospiraceae bacterium]HRF39835.1 exodeoxyribonuclease VII small subunit [Saprospiraceae bacterium]HRJ14873.1 exodeoxyribonuclease VII small subunit [Saprospiraceae bacterium]HRK83419.1 exodeoxyribonuclease VII small subunit [Saprospiraceae bacterium]
MKKAPFSYESAVLELQNIVQQLQEGNVSMDELAERARHAAALIRLCRERLRELETEVDSLFPEG